MPRTVRVLLRGDAEEVADALAGDGLELVDTEPVDCLVDAGPLSDEEPVTGGAGVPLVVLYDPAEPSVASRALDRGVARCVPVTGADGDGDLVRRTVERAVDTPEDPARVADADLLREGIDELHDVFFLFDHELRFRAWNARLGDVTGYTDDEIAEMEPTDFVVPEDREAVTAAIGNAIAEGRTTVEAAFRTQNGERLPYEFTGAALRADDGSLRGIVGIGRDIAERKQREAALREQAERLERLDRINGVIRAVLRDLTAAKTREEIEQAVVDRLADADPYRFAWIGGFERGDRAEPRAWAGEGAAYLDAREATSGEVTAENAIRDDEVEVVQRVAENPDAAGWREAAIENGFAAAAAVPLSNRATTLGVLCVYASEPDAFTDEEATMLEELGATIADAVTAAERRRALMGDLAVEVELGIDDESLFAVALSAAEECRVELVGGVPDGDAIRQFYRVTGADRESAVAVAERIGASAEFVRDDGDAFVVRVTDAAAVAHALAERGGRVVDGYAEDGAGRLVVQLPPGADVRALVETLDDRFGADLLARRERQRDTGSQGRLDELTDRQRTVLEAAFHAGYFDSPRANTGAEVAESLDISTPTFHEHLRVAERKLVAASLGEREE